MVSIYLYVNELLIASLCMDTMDYVKAELSARFHMKDIKTARMILGFEIRRDRAKQLPYLTQSAYMKKGLGKVRHASLETS